MPYPTPGRPGPADPPPGPDDPGGNSYAALVNSLGGIVWEADGRTFQFTFVSPQAERILGYPVRWWLDEPDFWRVHTHPDDVGWCTTFCLDTTARGEDHQFEYRMIAADGRVVWLRDVVTIHRAAGGAIRLRGIMLDVTDRKRLEEELCQAQKMEAVGRLAAGVAHDFNNLLTVIAGYTDVLLDGLGPGDPRRAHAREVAKAARRAADLTGQLLAFGRKQVVQPRVVDLNALVLDAERMLSRLIGEDVTLAAVLHPDVGSVRADPGQLHQVLLNLAVNARDAMPRGGTLTIETAGVVFGDGGVTPPPGVPAGRYAVLAVSDTGVGMTDEVRGRAFEPFFTTKGAGKGTGLGLATVYGIVRQSGGHVEVDTAVGQGATFRVYLPRADAAPEAAPEAAGAHLPRGSEAVLLVEDEDAVREFARFVLAGCGYAVLAAADGDEAVRAAAGFPGPIHLLVTDVVMPGVGGRELAGRLTAARPGLRVLYLSGYTDDAVVRHGVERDEVQFLQKPFAPAALARKVREVLDAPPPG